MLSAIVLAAGESRRMGSPKASLLTADGRPFIVSILETLTSCVDIDGIIVVTGIHHDVTVRAMADAHQERVHVVRNADPSRGQLSSLWTGLDAIPADAAAVLMTLVDVPTIHPSTVRVVVDTWKATHAPIVRPAMGARHGHPVLFDRSVFDELRRTPLDAGAKHVVRAHAHELVNVPVIDPGCLNDVDTPEDYQELR